MSKEHQSFILTRLFNCHFKYPLADLNKKNLIFKCKYKVYTHISIDKQKHKQTNKLREKPKVRQQ